jgi:hypothetical protein
MSKKKSILCTAIGAVLLVAACSDSSTQPRTGLTTTQLQSMTKSLTYLLGIGMGPITASVKAPLTINARRVMAIELPFGGHTACPEGGRVAVNGVFTGDSAGNGIFILTDTLVDCAVKDDHSNIWTFTSTPSIAATITELSNIHGDSIDLSNSTILLTDSGSVQYSTGSLSGTCPIQLSGRIEVSKGVPTADSATLSLSTAGTICGHTITRDTTSTISYTPELF